ncbi:MACROD [Mytilus coruscus]|uniref:MACROD n=1 Tax=Mytilus coruscus TaxID=42192 RepID=A0A6J8DD78_MYTCO|nr:MACROD [Mytilus coruscus]
MKRFHSLYVYFTQTKRILRTFKSPERTLSTAFITNSNKKNRTILGFPLLVSVDMERNKETHQNEPITRQKYSTKIKEQKDKFLLMPLEEKRNIYKCRNKYNTLEDVQTWEEYYSENKDKLLKKIAKKSNLGKSHGERREVRPDLNKKVSLWRGDITTLEIDAIVNAANESLLGGGGVDGAIHRAAGKKLVEECATLRGCKTGQAKITGGKFMEECATLRGCKTGQANINGGKFMEECATLRGCKTGQAKITGGKLMKESDTLRGCKTGQANITGGKFMEECATLRGCKTGQAKITGGYKLPAKYVIHTVGPIGEQKEMLKGAYDKCLQLIHENELVSVAFPCISTGIYGYSSEKAAPVAIETVRKCLEDEEKGEKIERVIFCLFLQKDVDIYEELMQHYFPIESDGSDRSNKESDKDNKVSALDQNGEENEHVIKTKKLKKDNEMKIMNEKVMDVNDLENKIPEDKKENILSENKTVIENKMEFHSETKASKDQKMEDSLQNKLMNEKEMEVDSMNKSSDDTKMADISDNKSPTEKKMEVSDGESSEKDMETNDGKPLLTVTKGNKESSSKTKGENKSPSKTKGEKASPSKPKPSGTVSKPITRKDLEKQETTYL